MSDATYRIDVRPTSGVYFKYKADVTRLSDDSLVARELGDTPEEAVEKARTVVARMNAPESFEGSFFVDDQGELVEQHSVKTTSETWYAS